MTLDDDSTPDDVPNNDGPLVDNEINNENADQDDHDVAVVTVVVPELVVPTTESIGDTIWEDLNRNGRQDAGEPGLGGVTVTLLKGDGSLAGQQVTTNSTGRYAFTVTAPGAYQIRVQAPPSYFISPADQGDDALDSDVDPVSGKTATISVAAGATITNVDAGLFRSATIGGVIWSDLDGNGQRGPGESGVAGVTVTLLDKDGQTTGKTALSEVDGSYAFENLRPGEYCVRVSAPEGRLFTEQDAVAQETLDSDVHPTTGQTAKTFLSAGEVDLTWNAGVKPAAATPQEWSSWLLSAPGASGTPHGNRDGDQFDDLMEFALALSPATGANGHDGFCIELDDDGNICALFRRPVGGVPGVTYTLEVGGSLVDPNDWVALTGLAPQVETHGNGTETLTYCGVDTVLAKKEFYGFVRLRVDLASPQSTSYSEVFGWQATWIKKQCETFNQPFVKKPLYVGTIGENTATALNVASASGDMPDMPLAKPLYIELIDGPHEGHRFDVTVSGKRVIGIAAGSARNTLASLPTGLAGSRFMLREHCTIDDLFKKTHFFGSRDPLTADRLLFFAGSGFESIYLLDSLGFFQWTNEADITLHDEGSRVVGPCEGLFIHPRNGRVLVRSYGMVRSNKLRCPLNAGYNFVGGGWPIDQSPLDRGMTQAAGFTAARNPEAADVIQLWIGDQLAGVEAYSGLFLLDATLGASRFLY